MGGYARRKSRANYRARKGGHASVFLPDANPQARPNPFARRAAQRRIVGAEDRTQLIQMRVCVACVATTEKVVRYRRGARSARAPRTACFTFILNKGLAFSKIGGYVA